MMNRPELGIYDWKDATVVYVPKWVRDYVRSIQPGNTHPVDTRQGYSFWENLDVW